MALVIGTLLGLDLFANSGFLLWAGMAPLALLVMHSLAQVPTCERLVALHAATVLSRAR